MTGPQVKFDLNLGTLIPLGAMAIALAVAWGKLTGAVDDLELRLTKVEAAGTAGEERLRAVENGQSNMTARLDSIREGLAEVRDYQRETNELLRALATTGKRP